MTLHRAVNQANQANQANQFHQTVNQRKNLKKTKILDCDR